MIDKELIKQEIKRRIDLYSIAEKDDSIFARMGELSSLINFIDSLPEESKKQPKFKVGDIITEMNVKKYNCYIVNRDRFKIDRDNVDFQHIIKVDFPCTAENFAKGEKNKSLSYLIGEQNNLFLQGKLYPIDDCFKTEEEAEDKLKEIMFSEIEQNEILIKNLKSENSKLYEKIQKIHDKRQKKLKYESFLNKLN